MLISKSLTTTIMNRVDKTLAYNTIHSRARGEQTLGSSATALRCPIIERPGTRSQIRMTIMATKKCTPLESS